MNVELRYLHAFRAVCEGGSLRAAAASLHRTEQAVSYQLRKLEEALGMPLFLRGQGPLMPNAAGERLLAFCRDMGRDWARVHEAMRDEPAGAQPLRISAVSGFGRYELLPLFREGPLADVPIRMSFPTAEEVVRQVEAGASDLGFVHRTPPQGSLRVIAAATEEVALIAPAGQPLPALDATTLAQADYVTYDESDYVFATWFTQVLGEKPARLRSVAHFEELEEVLDWVAAGRGLSIVPRACGRQSEARGDIVAMMQAGKPCLNTIYAVMDPVRAHPAWERTLSVVRARLGATEHH
jgi:DNA-binding transcriptional LysR family regulator